MLLHGTQPVSFLQPQSRLSICDASCLTRFSGQVSRKRFTFSSYRLRDMASCCPWAGLLLVFRFTRFWLPNCGGVACCSSQPHRVSPSDCCSSAVAFCS